ncbi:MAG: hypothetical protein Q4G43_02360 [Mobilicoccus sp.]|nr:hypothetical protein [Mobilicoccus sp.]
MAPRDTTTPARPRRVRQVNWTAFIGLGVVLGLLGGAIVHMMGPTVPTYGASTSILFFAAFGALIGGLLGGTAGVIADSVLRRGDRPRDAAVPD